MQLSVMSVFVIPILLPMMDIVCSSSIPPTATMAGNHKIVNRHAYYEQFGSLVSQDLTITSGAHVTDPQPRGTTSTINIATFSNTTTLINHTLPFTSFSIETRPTPVPAPTAFLLQEVAVEMPVYQARPAPELFFVGAMIPNVHSIMPDSTYGLQLTAAIQCQINLWNGNDTILPNTIVHPAIWSVGLQDAPSAAAGAFRFDNGNYLVTIGPYATDQVVVVQSLYQAKRLSFISYASTELLQFEDHLQLPTYFRVVPNDGYLASSIADVMVKMGWELVAPLFALGNDAGNAFQVLVGRLSSAGTLLICETLLGSAVLEEIQLWVDCVAQSSATTVLLWMNDTVAAQTIALLNANPNCSDYTIIAGGQWASVKNLDYFSQYSASAGKFTTNTSVPVTFPVSYLTGALLITPNEGSLAQYRACAEQVTPFNLQVADGPALWETSFNCLLPELHLEEKLDIPFCPAELGHRDHICWCLPTDNLADVSVTTGVNYIQDAASAAILALDMLFNKTKCEQIEFAGYRPNCDASTISTDDYLAALHNVRFTGLTGEVDLLRYETPSIYQSYDVGQVRSDGAIVQVGFCNVSGAYLATALLLFKEPPPQAIYPAPYSIYPVSTVTPQMVSLSTPTVAIFMGGAMLACLVSFCLIGYYLVHSDAPAIKAWNLYLIVMFHFGVTLVELSALFGALDIATWTCVTKTILFSVGWMFIATAIGTKAVEYVKMSWPVHAGKNSDLGLPMTAGTTLITSSIIAAPMFTLFVLYISDGVQPKIVRSTTKYEWYYVCETICSGYGNALAIAMTAYTGVIVLVSALVYGMASYLGTRSGRRLYGECRTLLLTCLNILVMFAFISPFYYTLGGLSGSPDARYRTRVLPTTLGLVISMCLIAYVLVPQINAWDEAVDQTSTDEEYEKLKRTWNYQPHIVGAEHDADSDEDRDADSSEWETAQSPLLAESRSSR